MPCATRTAAPTSLTNVLRLFVRIRSRRSPSRRKANSFEMTTCAEMDLGDEVLTGGFHTTVVQRSKLTSTMALLSSIKAQMLFVNFAWDSSTCSGGRSRFERVSRNHAAMRPCEAYTEEENLRDAIVTITNDRVGTGAIHSNQQQTPKRDFTTCTVVQLPGTLTSRFYPRQTGCGSSCLYIAR